MTQEEKAKRYDDAIEKLRSLHDDYDTVSTLIDIKEELENIFPELKESEDEKIRKDCIKYLDWEYQHCPSNENKIQIEKCIAWLERQGEQKPADKVEPKFKIEEEKWYVCTQTYVLRGKIVVIKGQAYQAEKDNVIKGENGCLFIDRHDGKALDYFRLWTIQDAKPGDILAIEPIQKEYTNSFVAIFKERGLDFFNSYCFVSFDGRFFEGESGHFINVHPATKEQRDQLEKAMADAGYTFDFDKKELKEIEQSPVWSEKAY